VSARWERRTRARARARPKRAQNNPMRRQLLLLLQHRSLRGRGRECACRRHTNLKATVGTAARAGSVSAPAPESTPAARHSAGVNHGRGSSRMPNREALHRPASKAAASPPFVAQRAWTQAPVQDGLGGDRRAVAVAVAKQDALSRAREWCGDGGREDVDGPGGKGAEAAEGRCRCVINEVWTAQGARSDLGLISGLIESDRPVRSYIYIGLHYDVILLYCLSYLPCHSHNVIVVLALCTIVDVLKTTACYFMRMEKGKRVKRSLGAFFRIVIWMVGRSTPQGGRGGGGRARYTVTFLGRRWTQRRRTLIPSQSSR